MKIICRKDMRAKGFFASFRIVTTKFPQPQYIIKDLLYYKQISDISHHKTNTCLSSSFFQLKTDTKQSPKLPILAPPNATVARAHTQNLSVDATYLTSRPMKIEHEVGWRCCRDQAMGGSTGGAEGAWRKNLSKRSPQNSLSQEDMVPTLWC